MSEPEWLTYLPRVGTPTIMLPHEHQSPVNSVPYVAPSSPAPPTQPGASPPRSVSCIRGEEIENLRVKVQNQLQTIVVLASDKIASSGSLECLSDISTSAKEVESLLGGSSMNCKSGFSLRAMIALNSSGRYGSPKLSQ